MQLYIYDRWGTKIYESNNTGCVWSPTCDDGTYFYVLTYNADCDTGNEGKTLKGFFTVYFITETVPLKSCSLFFSSLNCTFQTYTPSCTTSPPLPLKVPSQPFS